MANITYKRLPKEKAEMANITYKCLPKRQGPMANIKFKCLPTQAAAVKLYIRQAVEAAKDNLVTRGHEAG